MGNCCRHESSAMVWAGDDWGSEQSKRRRQQTVLFDGDDDDHRHVANIERQRLLGDQEKKKGPSSCFRSGSGSGSSSTSREVKIKITKRELEEILMTRGFVMQQQGLSMEQVLLDRLINGSDHKYGMEHEHHRPWKPALQSIPEVN